MSNPIIDEDGNKFWYANGKLHRIGEPAVEYADGIKVWYVNGFRHRLDGPAVEYRSGHKEWWVNDKYLSSPLGLLKHGANLEDIAEYFTPREIAQIKLDK